MESNKLDKDEAYSKHYYPKKRVKAARENKFKNR